MVNNQIDRNSTVVDMPLESAKEDLLNMMDYQEVLVDYLEHAKTPISISLQGEWGSGKTSLMKSIKNDLCDSGDASFYGIWINTWQFALHDSSVSSSQVVINILQIMVNHLIDLKPDSEHNEKIVKLIGRLGELSRKAKHVYDVASPFLLDEVSKKTVDGFLEKAKKFIEFWKKYSKKETIFDKDSLAGQLKNEIDELVQEILYNNNKKASSTSKKLGFIFFIDDLDRIDPVLSVNILENFKNIFDIEHCVFLLAVDSAVVIRGLKTKLGDYDNKNLYRSYFEKLIQVQLAMPLRYYDVKPFLKKYLVEIAFFHQNVLNDKKKFDDMIDELSNIVKMSIGKNPRNLKRLINTISLTNSIIRKHGAIIGASSKHLNDDGDRVTPIPTANTTVFFILICIQIAFPELYSFIQRKPAFVNWSDDYNYKSSKEKLDVYKTVRTLKEKFLIDGTASNCYNDDISISDWEIVLYNICNNKDALKDHYRNILLLLNKIIKIYNADELYISRELRLIVPWLSVTDVDAVFY